MPEAGKRTPATRIFNHLTPEERIDQACDLLAIGVLRLARKRGLVKEDEKAPGPSLKKTKPKTLHFPSRSNSKSSRKPAPA